MSSFTSELRYTNTGKNKHGRQIVRLSLPFTYRVGSSENKFGVVVPQGFETDLASVPRLFHKIFPPDGKYAKAAVLHDWLYRTGLVDRWMADAIFYDAMRNRNLPEGHRVGWWTAQAVYWSVRAFGWYGYDPVLDPAGDRLTHPLMC